MTDKLEPPELMPCPLCKGNATLDHEDDMAYIFCSHCGCGTISPACMSDKDAITAWNRRAPTIDPADEGLVLKIKIAMAQKDREMFERHTGHKLVGSDDVEAYDEKARHLIGVIAAINKERGN